MLALALQFAALGLAVFESASVIQSEQCMWGPILDDLTRSP